MCYFVIREENFELNSETFVSNQRLMDNYRMPILVKFEC